MNIRILPIFLMLCCLPATSQGADAYQDCTALVTRNPAQALSHAESWYETSKLPAARHCRALALFGLKRYDQAARELETLVDVVGQQQPELWLNLLKQAATARAAAGESKQALDILMLGISFADLKGRKNDSRELLLKHSEIARSSGNLLGAVQDLDHVVNLFPDDHSLRLKRAEIFIDLRDYDLAKQDINGVLKREPNNASAKALALRLSSLNKNGG